MLRTFAVLLLATVLTLTVIAQETSSSSLGWARLVG